MSNRERGRTNTKRGGASELSVPDALTPEQFFDRATGCDTPEKRLMFAVLLDATIQMQRGGSATRDAQRWIAGEDTNVLLSFEDVCSSLGLDPDYLGRGLLAWQSARERQDMTARRGPMRMLRISHPRIRPATRRRRRRAAGA